MKNIRLEKMFDKDSVSILIDVYKCGRKNLSLDDFILLKSIIFAMHEAIKGDEIKNEWYTPYQFYELYNGSKNFPNKLEEFIAYIISLAKQFPLQTIYEYKKDMYGKLL